MPRTTRTEQTRTREETNDITAAKEKTWTEFLELFGESTHEALEQHLNRNGVEALVCFENLDMCSSELGKRTALTIGPDCTYKTVAETDGKWLKDLPSQRQYPVAFVNRNGVKDND